MGFREIQEFVITLLNAEYSVYNILLELVKMYYIQKMF